MTGWRLRSSRSRRLGRAGVRAALLVLGCVCVAAIGASWQVFAPQAAATGRAPGGRFNDPVVRAVDIAGPSIVRLATLYTARITLNLCGQAVTLPASGSGYTLGATGSGAFISANGDILTADHVVDVPKVLLDQAIFQEPQSASDIANLLNTNPGCHASQAITANDIAAGYVQFAGIPYSVHYSSPRRLMWQSTAFTGPVSDTSQDSTLAGLLSAPYHVATVLSASSVDDNDVAIVHVSMSDTPSIQLDNSAAVAVEDQLTIIGYPGNGDVSDDSTNLLTPSVNVITVSAMKSGDNGEELIQVGGNVEHGDSGGPALDSQGHIVGIVSFAFVTPDSPGSTAFLRSSNSVRSLLGDSSVTTTPGAFETAWETAFSDYAATDSGHWDRAAREMDALSTRYPAFRAIQPYKDYADSAAAVEVAAPDSRTVEEIAAGALALLALVIGLVLLLVVRGRRAKRRLAYAPAGQMLPYAASYSYGYPSGAYYGPPSQQPRMFGTAAASSGFVAAPPQSPPAPPAYGNTGYPFYPQDAPMGRMPSDAHSMPLPSSATDGGQYALPQYDGAHSPASVSDIASLPDAAGAGVSWNGASYGANGANGAHTYGGTYGASAAGGASVSGYCVSGHPMPAGEQYCAQCGAPRWIAPSVSRDAQYPGQ